MSKDTYPEEKKASGLSSAKINPSDPLPRDETGRYLHLKLKRFPSMQDLTMPYARKTWKDFPYDASVSFAPTSSSSCRWCRRKIGKGVVRYQLFLQCHKGCKNSAFFHEDCIWKYPETAKLASVKEINGWQEMPKAEKQKIETAFNAFIKSEDILSINGAERADIAGTKRLLGEKDSTSASGKPGRLSKKKRN